MKTLSAAYFNLLKTSIGSGVLNFPYLFKTYGIILTFILTIITGFFAAIGLILLSICAGEIGRTADMSTLSQITIPHARFLVNLAVFIKCFGVSTSYIIITRQLLPSFLETITRSHAFYTKPPICLLFFVLCILPFALLYKMDKLKYTSFLGIVCILVVILAAIFRFFSTTVTSTSIKITTSPSLHWLGGLGKFIFSFTCHQNIFAVNTELQNNTLKRLKKLISCVAITAFLLYMSFGLSNYMIYGDNVKDNVLRNYPQDNLATIVRGLYVIVMGVSYPLQISPARVYLFNLFGLSIITRKIKIVHYSTTILLVGLTYLIAAMGTKLGIVYSIVGATASTFMCLMLPTIFYFNMEIRRTKTLTILAYCGFVLGIIIFGISLTSIFMFGQ